MDVGPHVHQNAHLEWGLFRQPEAILVIAEYLGDQFQLAGRRQVCTCIIQNRVVTQVGIQLAFSATRANRV